jgi:hypothetical protein
MTATDLQPVSIQQLPLDLWNRSRLWTEELLREFQVIASEVEDSTPRDLLTFVEETSERFGRFSEGTDTILETAHASGQSTIDLELNLPPAAGDAAVELRKLIGRAADFCHQGSLLTMAPEPEVVDFINWYLDEVKSQLAGAQPTPWPDRSLQS